MMRDPQWILQRLRLMSLGEVAARTGRTVQNTLDRLRYRFRSSEPKTDGIQGTEFGGARFFVALDARERVRSHLLRRCAWTATAADDALEHRFCFFAFEREWFGEHIQWNFEYRQRIATPLDFGPSLDYRDERKVGDIKYAWEHNRHHHLVELAKACYLTDDERYARELVEQVDSWITQCPVPYGVNWASGLEVAIRLINWTVALFYLGEAPAASPTLVGEFRRRWLASAREHMEFLARHLSSHSSANNHLIGEACGLFIGGLCYRFPRSDRWRDLGKAILEREARAQTWPDGVNKEQAIGYQAFVFDFLLLSGLLGERNGVMFSAEYWRILESMADYVSAVIDDQGEVPQIGDDDDGHVVRFSYHPSYRPFRSLLATAGRRFRRPELIPATATEDEKTFWLLGEESSDRKPAAAREDRPARAFRHGGYFLLGGAGAQLLFDCGPLGYLSLAAHGHADALSVVLRYRGRWFLVDPGTYAYHTNPAWRSYFRGTGAHNTITCDNQDQSVSGGNFLWGRKAQCTLHRWDGHTVCGHHTGYARLADPVIHEREVAFLGERNTFRVVDRIRAAGHHRLRQSWHFSPSCTCSREERGWVIDNDGTCVRLVPDALTREQTLHRGSTTPIAGWYSAGYDRKVPSPTLTCDAAVRGDTEFVTLIELL